MNLPDQEGYTPLHLAVKSVDSVESTRPVRFLLIRGADKERIDKQGRTPMDILDEVRSPDLANELRRMLGEGKKLECLMLSAPTRLVKRNSRTMTFYLLLFFTMFIIQYFFTFPSKLLHLFSLPRSYRTSCSTSLPEHGSDNRMPSLLPTCIFHEAWLHHQRRS